MTDTDLDIDFSDAPKGQNILLVEDSDPDIILIADRLESMWPDSKIMAVKSIKAAYETYKKHDFDLVLLDLNLPDGVGPGTVKEVRRFNRKVPIIVITGMGTDITVSEALKLGANHVVLKSQIMNSDFVNVLEQHMGERA